MQLLAIVWHPNENWDALSESEKLGYLKTLDDAINQARSNGMVVLGWSKIDQTLPKAPKEGFVGVFGVSHVDMVHQLEKSAAEAEWYNYFDSTNISIALEGATEVEPHKIYARMLGVAME